MMPDFSTYDAFLNNISEQHLRRALASAPFPIMLHAEDGEVLQINATWTELTGYTHQDIPTTKAWAQRAYGSRAATVLENIIAKKYSLKSRWEEGEFTITTSDGSQRIWQFSSAPLGQLPDGRRVVISMAADITKLREAENSLRESEERYRTIYQQAAVGLAQATLDGKLLDVNPRLCAMLGYSREELLAKNIVEIIHPDERLCFLPEQQRLFRGEISYLFQETRYLRKDGSNFWSSTGVSLVCNATSQPQQVLRVIRDISERKQAQTTVEQKLRQEQALKRVLQTIHNSLDLETIFATATAETAQLLPELDCFVVQYFPSQGIWKHVAEFRHAPNLPPTIGLEIIDRGNPFAAQLKQLQTVRVEATDNLEDQINQEVAQKIPGAWLIIPLVIEAKIWGSFTLNTIQQPFNWTDEQVELAQAVAHQLELAIQQAELYRQVEASEQRFRNMAANVPGAIFRYVLHPDGSDAVIYMSPGCYELWEVKAEVVVEDAQILWEVIHPDDRSAMYESVLDSARTLEPWFWQWRIITPSGKMKWLEAAGRPERHDNGDVVWDTLIMDVSDRLQAEAALHESEERLHLVTENMSDLVCLHSPEGRYLYLTPSSQTLLGYSPKELIGRDPKELFHPDECERVSLKAYRSALNGISGPITYRIREKTGKYIWLETLTKTIFDEQGQVTHLQTTSREVSARIQAEEQLKHDALHDGLTGLPNRSLLMERLDLALKRAKRSREFKFALLFLDLDNFKVVNDSLGHLVGDELLRAVGRQLTELIRETDLAARLGGDEFVILLEEIEEIEGVVRVAERILAVLSSPLQMAEREIFTSTSIGIVVGTSSYQHAEELLRDADLAMYRAKQSGPGRYALFDPAMHLQVLQRLHLETDLRKALENRELVLYYQPVINLETLVIQGFEALIRWQHPQWGLVSPGEFIPIAEETGLILTLGRWVLHTACQQLATWQAQFPNKPLRISVNLSVKQLQEMLLPQLEEVLTKYPLQDDSLVLEITESMLVQNVESTYDLLAEIKAKGIRLSLDDFGTGYSCLSYLHQLPVSDLKIDRSFVSPTEADARHQLIAESIIALSNLLELKVIAEGVETLPQLQWLKKLGCELGQGFLFSPPVPTAQATELLQGIESKSV